MNSNESKTSIVAQAAKGTLIGSALVVTGFAAAADCTGAAALTVRPDAGIAPLADSTAQLLLRDHSAFLTGADAQERPAPDGVYRLANDQVIKVEGGRVQFQSILAQGSKGWKLWTRSARGQAPADDADVQSVFESLLS
jgi:hypothetical protein